MTLLETLGLEKTHKVVAVGDFVQIIRNDEDEEAAKAEMQGWRFEITPEIVGIK